MDDPERVATAVTSPRSRMDHHVTTNPATFDRNQSNNLNQAKSEETFRESEQYPRTPAVINEEKAETQPELGVQHNSIESIGQEPNNDGVEAASDGISTDQPEDPLETLDESSQFFRSVEANRPRFTSVIVGRRIQVLCQTELGERQKAGGRITAFHYSHPKEGIGLQMSWHHVIEFDDGGQQRFDLDKRWKRGIVWIDGCPDYMATEASQLSEAVTTQQTEKSRGKKRSSSDDSGAIHGKRSCYAKKTTSHSTNTSCVTYEVDKRGEVLIGRRCQVLFNMTDSSKQWFLGTTTDFCGDEGYYHYHIHFEDDEKIWMELRKGGYRFLPM